MTFLEAIAREEGFGVVGSRSQRNNNPGDINWGVFARAHGADRLEVIPPGNHGEPRFAHFPTPEIGFAAMRALFLSPSYAALTVRAALLRYAPPSDGNDTSAYEANVCKWAGCAPSDIVSHLA